MIIKGDFTLMSIAVYGHLASEEPSSEPSTLKFAGSALPEVKPRPLPASIDVLSMPDPALLARQLLSSCKAASLPLESVLKHYCGLPIESEDQDQNGDSPSQPSPPLPDLFLDGSDGQAVDVALQFMRYFEEVVSASPQLCALIDS